MLDAQKTVVPDVFTVTWDKDAISYTERYNSSDDELASMMAENTREIVEKYIEEFEEEDNKVFDADTSVHRDDDDVVVDVTVTHNSEDKFKILGPAMLATEMMVILAVVNPKIWKGIVGSTQQVAKETDAMMSATDLIGSLASENGGDGNE